MSTCPIDVNIDSNIPGHIIGAIVYGVCGSFFIKSPFPPLALYLAFHVLLFWPGLYRELDEPYRMEYLIYPVISLIFSIMNGSLLSFILETNRLVDFRIDRYKLEVNAPYDDKRRIIFESPVIALCAFFITGGYLFLTGAFSDGCGVASNTVSLGVGITMIVVGSIGIIAIMIYVFFFGNDVDNIYQRRINIKYLLLLSFYMITPAFYDLIDGSDLKGVWMILYLTFISIIAILYIGFLGFIAYGPLFYSGFLKVITTDIPSYMSIKSGEYQNDNMCKPQYLRSKKRIISRTYTEQGNSLKLRQARDKFKNTSLVLWNIFLLYIIILLPIIAGYLTDIFFTDIESWPVLIAVVSTEIFIFIILGIVGYKDLLPEVILIHKKMEKEDAKIISLNQLS